MIKANEYRLGIIVMDVEPYDKIYKVDINMLVNAINGISYRSIPLTPEWLERLGFQSRQEPDEPLIYSILKMDLDICLSDDGYYLYTNNTDPWHNRAIGRRIEYVHQIQNIYLDLTGEELNVKL